jgi:hypothetical protein
MIVDRRRSDRDRRRGVRVPAIFAVKNAVGRAVELDQAEDIGPSGMSLRRPQQLPCPPQTRVRLTFELPESRALIAVSGVVVSDRAAGPFRRTGVRFEIEDDVQARLIELYCAGHGDA